MENDIFWSEIGSGFGEPGGTLPPRIPGSNPAAGLMIPLKIQLFRERLSENVHATIPIVIVGGFEFTVFQFERMARETMDVCLQVLKEQCQEQRINHIPYYLSDLLRSHFFRQPFSK